MGSAVPSRVSLLMSILRLNMVLTYGIPPGYLLKPPYAIGSIPSLSGHHTNAYRWRSLQRVRRHRVNKPQGSSKTGAGLAGHYGPINMRLSFPHPLNWYKVGMLKVPANYSVYYLECCHFSSKHKYRLQRIQTTNREDCLVFFSCH